ncbi:MAG: DUF1911 domain-containing protein [Sphingobacteriales bacterium]|nr:DUF1911 domain-containing protein [Sphingobacteriales bacterium]
MNTFLKFISEADEAIALGKSYIASGKYSQDKINSFNRMMFYSSIRKPIAQYSAGDSKENISNSFLESITAFEIGFRWEGFHRSYAMYDQIIWMLSFAILCNISDADLLRIIAILQRDHANDLLISTLVHYRLPNTMGAYKSNFIQKSPYSHLAPLLNGKDRSAAFIRNYLDKKWYQGHKDAPWYEAHLRTKVNSFFGYWAWEVAALVKIFNINDETLQLQNYYPFRAVHW